MSFVATNTRLFSTTVLPSFRPSVRSSVLPSFRLSVRPFFRPSSRPSVRPSVRPPNKKQWKKDKRSLEVRSFLSWAANKKGWSQAIRAAPGVTVSISVFVSGVEATAVTGSVYAGTPDSTRIEKLEEDNEKLKTEIEWLKGQMKKTHSDEKYLSEGEEEAKSLWGRAFQSGIQK